jgi:hypothetical protein
MNPEAQLRVEWGSLDPLGHPNNLEEINQKEEGKMC